MNKKLLLIAIPALMVMSSCTYMQSATKVELFKEDTVAHEEVFGTLQPRLLGDPNEDPASGPKVGVQFKKYEKVADSGEWFYAVRYVAAVSYTSLDGVTAQWNRAVSRKDGVQINAWAGGEGRQSKVLYPSLNNGEGAVNATDETGGSFNNYLVYSLYDIPENHVSSFIAAYLTISEAGQPEVTTKVIAARAGGERCFSFEQNKAAGYFIQGKINGVANTILDLNDEPTEATDHAEERSVSLKEDDDFGCFYYNPGTSFRFFGYDMNIGDSVCDYYLEQSGSTQYMKLRANATYNLYMSDTDLFSVSDPENPTVTLYFHPGANWRSSTQKFAIWYDSAFHPFAVHDAENNMYKLENFPFTQFYSNLVFTRHDASIDGYAWDWDNNLWGKTADQTYPRDGRPNKRVANVYDEDWGGKTNDPARVSWTVLS